MVISLLILARAFHFGSGMILVGVVAFRWLILLPAFADEVDDPWQKFLPLFLRLNQMFIWSGITLLISALALFWVVSAGMSGKSLTEGFSSAATLEAVFFQTQFGTVFRWRLGFAVVLGIMMWRLSRTQWQARRTQSALEIASGLVATALMVSFAWTGHVAATGGADFFWRITADALHLFAAAIWPAGLLPFALFLAHARQIKDVSHLIPMLTVISRFSSVSLITVGVLATTGIVNSYFLVGSFQALFTTTYGQVLCVKLFLFGLMLGIAAGNRFRILPLLFAQTTKPDQSAIFSLVQHLQTFVIAESSLATVLIVVVSFLGATSPPR